MNHALNELPRQVPDQDLYIVSLMATGERDAREPGPTCRAAGRPERTKPRLAKFSKTAPA
jgi:hypothetical protein